MKRSSRLIMAAMFIVAVALILPFLLAAQDDMSSEEQNIEVAMQAIELWNNAGDVTVEEANEVFAFPVLRHGGLASGSEVNFGAASFTSLLNETVTFIWPDFEIQIENILADGDLVVVHTELSGTFEGLIGDDNIIRPGEFLEPDGLKHTWEFVFMYRFEDGKIVEEWWFWNTEYFAALSGQS